MYSTLKRKQTPFSQSIKIQNFKLPLYSYPKYTNLSSGGFLRWFKKQSLNVSKQ